MSRRPLVPEAKEALDKIRTESANEIGIELNNKYKGNISSKFNSMYRIFCKKYPLIMCWNNI